MASASLDILNSAPGYVLKNARVPIVCLPTVLTDDLIGRSHEGLAEADIVVEDGKIAAIVVAGMGTAPAGGLPMIDMRGGQVWPTFVDMHTHIDKGHIWERSRNPTGDFEGALLTVRADREANWTREDIEARMEFSLRSAYAHGTSLLRTHIDSLPPHHKLTWPLFREMRERWKGRVDLQAVCLMPVEATRDADYFEALIDEVAASGGLIGGHPDMGPELESDLDRLLRAAMDRGLDIDFHIDETRDPGARTLRAVADAVIRNGFEGKVVAGHCCSLARQESDEAARTIDRVVEAGIGVVSLPMCNMYLQDRFAGCTPRWRGVTLFQELRSAGGDVAVASDNTRDPFYAYGDLDPVEVFREAVRILHLDHPLDEAAKVVTTSPAKMLRRPDSGVLAVGGPADMVLFSARFWSEFLSRPQADRMVLRSGRPIDRTLPDYRDLDPVAGIA
ncbi:Cytosine deaminase [Hartmannibacter diazotrophicus]|uniref:Cytosine deaminase n=1 Tax=Hartmannibacter diazotrophicus TaxID=1482074 RepID=A0A2C9DDC4_9HYPH|nr:cytosine deaminase [Hartmannibacter diazotrophicus]SON58243.1 Cytosine deaminase [Hartmannibacter diazotrophicus]